MITRNIVYSSSNPTANEIYKINKLINNMIARARNGRTNIKTIPFFSMPHERFTAQKVNLLKRSV
jgi:hypothetical protein